eukprot:TRINITY_DN630_c0_g1_i2.p5 TRINITY_DN630_c0_g1~~TRINITY_DN630_c0_g1_i2.p5  ORF type:complete len:122 (-),score=40.32 TRINITY_DN630_c0_g1_i2:301-666(-)
MIIVYGAGIAAGYIQAEEAVMGLTRTADGHEKLEKFAKKEEETIGLIVENRYSIVGGVWVASMIGSIAAAWGNPNLRTSQKVIHARLYAQAATLAALALGGVAASLSDTKHQNPFEEINLK